jgi:hypothetical protein
MTAQEIQQGRMMVESATAAVRLAEFIILKVSHQLQSPWGLNGYGSRKVEPYKKTLSWNTKQAQKHITQYGILFFISGTER